jgi:predicted TIM-barrel fold metal-dependent hydrolase
MVERNIPIFIPVGESSGVSGWHMIENILSEVQELTLVVTDHGAWGDDRFFRPLVERYRNLYLDISKYELDGGIKDFCNKYGAERLLFGTGFPQLNPGGPIFTLIHADITEKERQKIASGNLERILGRVKL